MPPPSRARAGLRGRWVSFRSGLGTTGTLPLAVLVGLASVQSFDLTAFGVLSPDIRHSFHLSNAGIDAVASLTTAVPIVFSIWVGYLGDRHSRIRMSRIGGILWGVTAIVTGLAPVLAILAVARIAGGIGYLNAETVYPSLLADYYPPEGLGSVFTGYRFGSQGVGLLGAPLAGAIAALVGWRPTFVVLALPTFALVFSLRYLREPARGISLGLSMGQGREGSVVDGFRRVRRIRTLKRTWASAFLFGAGTIPFATVANNFFKDVYHLGDSARGGVTALLGIGGLIGIAYGGRLTNRALLAGRIDRLPVVSGLLVVSFGFLSVLLGVIPNLAVALMLSGVVTIGAFGFLPSYTTMVSLIAPASVRSQAYAWSLMFYALGAILITPAIGAIGDAHGQRVSLAVLGVVVAGGGAVAASARRFVAADAAGAVRGDVPEGPADAVVEIDGGGATTPVTEPAAQATGPAVPAKKAAAKRRAAAKTPVAAKRAVTPKKATPATREKSAAAAREKSAAAAREKSPPATRGKSVSATKAKAGAPARVRREP